MRPVDSIDCAVKTNIHPILRTYHHQVAADKQHQKTNFTGIWNHVTSPVLQPWPRINHEQLLAIKK